MTTRELIETLRERHAFNPKPQPADFAVLHVPFDSLGAGRHTEIALERAARAGERVALIGGSGVGKSSVIAHVLGFGSGFAPVWLSVANESTEVATEASRFAAHAVQVLARYAEETDLAPEAERDRYLRAVADRKVLPSTEKGVSLGVKLAPWIGEVGLQGDSQADLTRRRAHTIGSGVRRGARGDDRPGEDHATGPGVDPGRLRSLVQRR
ncbi:MAG: hypothetical protein M3340_15240 [Actinomycetota bacterium]|nr:hypothetical protein [Actinomycetota bacterium]